VTLTPELVLHGRYRLVERIAVGGMGEVWRAVDTTLDRQVAVKALKAEYADDPDFLARFRAEARHTAALLHPGIAGVYDYGEVGDGQGRSGATTAYLVMELVDGEPLSTVLSREGRLDPPRALDVIGQAALALQAAHDAGVVHRDVKPGNLLVRPDGVVKVTDFGIARATDTAPITATGTVLGTAYYLSPEQASGVAVGPASDVYSLGVVLHECLTGRRPFTGESAVAVALAHQRQPVPPLPPDLPPSVRDLVARALAKDPADRPDSAGRFGRDLLAVKQAAYGGEGDTPTVVIPPAVARAGGPDDTRVLTRGTRPVAAGPPPSTRGARGPAAPPRRPAPARAPGRGGAAGPRAPRVLGGSPAEHSRRSGAGRPAAASRARSRARTRRGPARARRRARPRRRGGARRQRAHRGGGRARRRPRRRRVVPGAGHGRAAAGRPRGRQQRGRGPGRHPR